jgi:hypothetical protein
VAGDAAGFGLDAAGLGVVAAGLGLESLLLPVLEEGVEGVVDPPDDAWSQTAGPGIWKVCGSALFTSNLAKAPLGSYKLRVKSVRMRDRS